MSDDTVGPDDLRAALSGVDWPGPEGSVDDITEIDDGVNDVWAFATGLEEPARAVCKFATFSDPSAFQAGTQAARLVAEYTDVPVPEVHALRADPPDLPAFQVTEFLPGEPLAGHPDPEDPGPARALGWVIGELGKIPDDQTAGYGWIQPSETTPTASDAGPGVEAEYETCSEWLVEFGCKLYDHLPSHERLAAVARDVPAYLREHSDRFPDAPEASVVVTDFGPGNLLAPGGAVSDGSLDELTGVIDVERAKIGPMAFNAVNAEFLMQRPIDDPGPVIDALYEPLPFGPDMPRRDLYLLVAMGREVAALDLWYEEGSETYEKRGSRLVGEIERIVS